MAPTPNLMLDTLDGRPGPHPPIWLMRQAGRYLAEYREVRSQVGGFLELCFDPDRAAEVTLQPVRRYAMDAAILFSDILVVPHALGQHVRFEEGEGPKLTPLRDQQDIDGLSMAGVEATVGPVWKTVETVKAALPESVALIGFAGSPWTVATYMVEGGGSKDFSAVKALGLGEPALFDTLLQRIVDASVLYLDGQVRAGAQAIKLFDSWAGAVPAEKFEAWVIEPTKAIVEALKRAHPSVPVIGFPRGAGTLYWSYIDALPIDAVAVDPSVPLAEMQRLQKRLPVQGNLDPAYLLAGGEPLRTATGNLLAGLAGGPFVFNLGHGINRFTPPEHVAALVDQVRGG